MFGGALFLHFRVLENEKCFQLLRRLELSSGVSE